MRAKIRAVYSGLASVMLVSAAVLGANVATADSIQHQSYQRTSQTEACTSQPGETPWQAGWGADSSWKPSWEQWANGGKGGWTCTRSITWAKTSVAGGSSTGAYGLGDIGPGGGLIFLISGGLTYEMAPKTWSGSSSDDTPTLTWCSDTTSILTGANGLAVGTGSANTTAMQSPACTSGAAVSARAYRGGGFSDWFLPSTDELNAMCNYSRNPTAPSAPSVSCYVGSGTSQDTAFAAGTYGFANNEYWSSSQYYTVDAYIQNFSTGNPLFATKGSARWVRPVRAF
jgi:hypothetical protein